MIHLRILGSPSLEDSNGGDASGLLSQPKRLALLAYLAAGGRHLVARDKVLGAFWGEQPEERARHALNQGLHVLRRELGTSAITARGERLGVDPARVWCDAAEFREALRAADRIRALELYRGPLLDGLFVSDAPEFERWLEETRAELHSLAAAAAARLADEAVARRESSAVALATRAAELAPLDEPAARRLITLLDREGRPGAAVAAFDAFARRLHTDCELTPSAELRAVVATIRARAAAASAPSPPAAPASAPAIASPAHLPSHSPVPPLRVAPRSRLRRAAIVVGIVALASAGAWALREQGKQLHASRAAGAAELGRVAVLPFLVQGDLRRGDSLGRSLVELLGSRLDGAGAVHVVPADSVLRSSEPESPVAAASRLSAGSVIEGSLTGSSGTVHIRAAWRRRQDRTLIAEATVEGSASRLFELLDRLAIQLLAAAQPFPRGALARTAALSAPSLPALKAYLEGEHAFGEGRFTAATRAFERAAAADSTFALAHYRLGQAALWAEDFPLAAVDAGALAHRHAAALPETDRLLLTGFNEWRRGGSEEAASEYLGILATDRDNLEAWFQLGETLFHYNPVRGRPVSDSRDAFVQVLRLDPDHWGALWHLALLDAMERRTADMDRRFDHLIHLGPGTDFALEIAVLRACAHRDGPALARQNGALRAIGDSHLLDIAWRCAIYGRDLEGTEAITRLLLERHDVNYSQGAARQMLAGVEMARGRRARAFAELDSIGSPGLAWSLGPRTDFALLPREAGGGSASELARLAREWQRWSSPPTNWLDPETWKQRRVAALGRLAAALGDSTAAELWAKRVEDGVDPPEARGQAHAMAVAIRAAIAAAGDPAQALRDHESALPEVWFGDLVSSPGASRAWARFNRAEALDRLGRSQEALRWYGSLDELSVADMAYAPIARLRRAEIYERLGDTSATAAEYSRFLDLWKDADTELQPLVTRARERLTRLSAHR